MSWNRIKAPAPPPISRSFADFLLVHAALVVALVASWIRNSHNGNEIVAINEAHYAIRQYLHLFLPLSLIFPAALYASGVYKDHSRWNLNRRVIALLRGIAIGLVGFVSISLLFLSGSSLGSRTLALFCFVLVLMLVVTRLGELAIVAGLRAPELEEAAPQAEDLPVLVIGGAGYIGASLVPKLLAAGKRVRVLDSLVYGDAPLRDVMDHPNFELIVGDCRNMQTAIRAATGVESIVHLAAIVGDPACAQEAQTALEVNFAATRMLIQIAKGHRIKRFIFASSCSVYGISDDVMTEESPKNPISLYARTKVDSEDALLAAATTDFQPTILRLATVFGLSARPRFDLVVNLLAAKACQGDPITVFNGEQWRPFIHVDDVAEGFKQMLAAPLEVVGGKVFNLGDARLNYTLTDVANTILQIFPEASVVHSAVTDRRNYRVSFDKISTAVGFKCTKTISDGVLEIQAGFASGQFLDYTSFQYNNQKFLLMAGSPLNQEEEDETLMAAFAQSKPLAHAAGAGL